MPSDSFPHFSFSGDARTRGLAYGRALGERIHATFALYDDRLFSRSALLRTEIVERAERVRGLVGGFNGDYVAELDGIAEGASVARWQIYALNARTEILNANVGECTTLCFPKARLLGQTWDWVDALEDLAILVTYELLDGGRVLTFTEPGMLAKIGLNSAGLGVCLNFLDPCRLRGLGAPDAHEHCCRRLQLAKMTDRSSSAVTQTRKYRPCHRSNGNSLIKRGGLSPGRCNIYRWSNRPK